MQSREEFVELKGPLWHEFAEFTEFSNTKTELIPVERLNQSNFIVEFVIIGVCLVSFTLLIRLVYSHIQLLRLKKRSKVMYRNGSKIYCSEINSPFSYFNAVFIPDSLADSSTMDTILKHEIVHITKKHSLDRVFIEILTSLIWFNPIQYLFRNRLIETHEFQADEEVISIQKDPIEYQEILYNQINSKNAVITANHFKFNTIKTRIKMINKNKKLSKWHYLMILPVFALMTFSFANKEDAEFIAPLKSDVSDVLEYVKNVSDSYRPSIFPLKDADGVKLSSRFGKRVDPFLKVEKMHDGVDFKSMSGNPVLATANGKVVEAGDLGPYGKKIVISHNDIYQTSYAHLSQIKVEKGDLVKRGDVIGASGNSGKSRGSHLHYEVKEIGKGFIDPIDFINDYDFKRNNTTKLDKNTPSILPLKDTGGVKLTARYGVRVHPILKVERLHEGIDLKTYSGNAVLATADGIVTEAGSIYESSWGKLIRISHKGTYETVYAHLSVVSVEEGEMVKRGDIIGKAGTTGESTGPHLHYEVKETDKGFLDPVDFINDFDFKSNSVKEENDVARLGKSNQKLKVVIDPGHGGADNGISSSNLSEKEIALKVATLVRENFNSSDEVEIILTRSRDEEVSLKDRVIKSEGADLFISLHVESHEDENEDMMVAIYNDHNENADHSKYFCELLSDEFHAINRKFEVGYTDGYYVLQNSKSPAILFNIGYFSHHESEKYLNSEEGLKEIAHELSDAIKTSL